MQKIAHHRVLKQLLAAVKLHEISMEPDEETGDRTMTVDGEFVAIKMVQ